MEREPNRLHCVTCGKAKSTVKCAGCSLDYCFDHLNDHRNQLGLQLDEIQINRDLIKQTFNEQSTNIENDVLFKQIHQWENDSIRLIQEIAQECKQILTQHLAERIHRLEMNLYEVTCQIKQIREENDFNELDLTHLQQKLKALSQELDKPPNISIRQHSTLFINKISVVRSNQQLVPSSINSNTKWKQDGITVAGGNGEGNELNQVNNPLGICVDDDNQCVYIADHANDRVVKWKYDANSGEVVAGGTGQGNQLNQLSYPTDVIIDKKTDSLIICDWGNRRVIRWSLQNNTTPEILISDIDCFGVRMDRNGDLYVSDTKKHEVRRWKIGEKNGTIVAGRNGEGNGLNQLNQPRFVFIDKDYSVYVSDWMNHRVMKWMRGAKEGIIVAGGQGPGNNLSQLNSPHGVIVDREGSVYVAETGNHRIMRWCPGSKQGHIIVGGNGKGEQSNQLNEPIGFSIDEQGNLYVVDCYNHRVQKFLRD